MIEKDDWRLRGQDAYLRGKTFYFHKFKPTPRNDHEHCKFCWKKIGVDGIEAGYSTLDDYCWVCEECFADFENPFSFKRFQEIEFDGKSITSVIGAETESIVNDKKVYKISRLVSLLNNLSGVKFASEEMRIMPANVELSLDPKKSHKIEIVDNTVVATSDNILNKLMNIQADGHQWVYFA